MDSGPTTDGYETFVRRIVRWVTTTDRGWQATLLGVAIALGVAVGPL